MPGITLNITSRMRLREFIVYTLSIFSLLSISLQAQNPDRFDRTIAKLTNELELNVDQEIQVRAILQSSFEQMDEVRDKYRGNREVMSMAMQEEYDTMNEQIEALLDEGQTEKFADIKEEFEAKRGGRGSGKGGGKGGGQGGGQGGGRGGGMQQRPY